MLAEARAKVFGGAPRPDVLNTWKNNTLGKTASVPEYLADRSTRKGMTLDVITPVGPKGVVVNAAGTNSRRDAGDVTQDGCDVTLNFAPPSLLGQASGSAMKPKSAGRIINFASLQSRRAFTKGISYGASKGGVEQMTRAMAGTWSGNGTAADAGAHGFFRGKPANPELAQRNADQTCSGQNHEPSDPAGPQGFFCTAASDDVTGQTLFVEEGFTAK